MLVEYGINVKNWNVYGIIPKSVYEKRAKLMQYREEERRLQEKKRKAGEHTEWKKGWKKGPLKRCRPRN